MHAMCHHLVILSITECVGQHLHSFSWIRTLVTAIALPFCSGGKMYVLQNKTTIISLNKKFKGE